MRLLSEGGDPSPLQHSGLARYLGSVFGARAYHPTGHARQRHHELWRHSYPQLTEPADGLTGRLIARAEAHTIRLALIYTLLDGANKIRPEQLHAALALWDYAARSAARAINHSPGDPLAEQIHAAIARSTDGLTRTQIRDLLHRNLPAERVDQALQTLARADRATRRHTATAGRPAETWTATKPAA